jgi:hypothetical protein
MTLPTTLRDLNLNWWFDDEAQPFPTGIVDTPLIQLSKLGVSNEILQSLTAAFVHDFSPDRKTWYLIFFDDVDPAAALRAGSMGRFMLMFFVDPMTGDRLGCSLMNHASS